MGGPFWNSLKQAIGCFVDVVAVDTKSGLWECDGYARLGFLSREATYLPFTIY